jgi:hypothetical protein
MRRQELPAAGGWEDNWWTRTSTGAWEDDGLARPRSAVADLARPPLETKEESGGGGAKAYGPQVGLLRCARSPPPPLPHRWC